MAGQPFRLLLGKFWTAKFYRDIVKLVLYIFPLKETNPAVYEAWKVDHKGKCHLHNEGSTSSSGGF